VVRKKKKPVRRATAPNPRLSEALDQVDSLMERGHWDRARERLEDLIHTYPQRPEPLRKMIEVAVNLDDTHLYQQGCEALFALCPDDRDLPFMLARAYGRNRWLGLCLSMTRRALARDPSHEQAGVTRKVLAELEPLVNEEITRLGLDGPDGLECLTLHDQVRSFLAQGRFDRAEQAAEALLKRRPRFAPACNNGAEACYHAGRVAQAIDLEQRLLVLEPDNVFALSNLVRFLCASGQVEEARRQAERLRAIEPPALDQAVKQAEALAWLGDDKGVLAVFDRAHHLLGTQNPEDDALLYHLAAVASYRQGREEMALTRWRFALRAMPDLDLARDNLDDLGRPVGQRHAPWSYSFTYYVPRRLIDELVRRIGSGRRQGDAEAGLREAQRYLRDHPELEGLVPLLLDRSDKAGRELALHLAGLYRTPAILQAARDFALGQRGPDQMRLQAAQLAAQAGLFPAGPTRLWLEGEWRDIVLQRFEISGEAVQRSHAPGVFDLIGRGVSALQAGDYAQAERVLRQALAIDPDDPVVLNNLAAACAHQGRTEESEALSIRLHERHPDYLFGRTALASLAAQRGEFERARKLLEPLVTREKLHFGEFAALCMAQLNLHLAAGERQQAEHWLGMWRNAMPDHPAIPSFEERVRRC
jgi:tetratricopeptide (TPR) repeat protein